MRYIVEEIPEDTNSKRAFKYPLLHVKFSHSVSQEYELSIFGNLFSLLRYRTATMTRAPSFCALAEERRHHLSKKSAALRFMLGLRSTQELLDCNRPLSCKSDEGILYDGLMYITSNEIHTEEDYPYRACSGKCRTNKVVFGFEGSRSGIPQRCMRDELGSLILVYFWIPQLIHCQMSFGSLILVYFIIL
ncbi:cathepsin L [Salvia divinorum]|uniref:Cathepsin L n=1 Tax=Salvia divinorum TaxID=28513 RepID=A0ABD1H1W5_SALDI